jgi:hypothetical protein
VEEVVVVKDATLIEESMLELLHMREHWNTEQEVYYDIDDKLEYNL